MYIQQFQSHGYPSAMVSNSNISAPVLDIDRQALYICIEDMACKLIWVYYIYIDI